METLKITSEIKVGGRYELIVAGGGVAGVAAALSARRNGINRVLLIEKTINLGGLATTGMINLFVPMCNGRGKQIITGMAEELLRDSIKYGYDTLPEEWKNGEPDSPTKARYCTRYSPWIFSFVLAEKLRNENIDILLDTTIADAVCENGHVCGLVLESKSGREFYEADYIVDATGDSDVFFRAGAPTVDGQNYFTYEANQITLESCKRAYEAGNIKEAFVRAHGGPASLYGTNQPEGKRLYRGTTKEDVTEYVLDNTSLLLEALKNDDRCSRELTQIPFMPQFRTTRHIAADYSLKMADVYRHFEDSVGAICDFDHRDRLFEVPFRTMINSGYDNIIAAGRCVSGEGFAWDILRVIPPAILTGEAAGAACAAAFENKLPIFGVDTSKLAETLAKGGVTIHFNDSLIPEDREAFGEALNVES